MNSARLEKQRAVLAVANAAANKAKEFEDVLDGEDPRSTLWGVFHPQIPDSYKAALEQCPVHELSVPEAVMAFLALRDQFQFVGPAIQTYWDGPRKHPDFGIMLEKLGGADFVDAFSTAENVLKHNAAVHLKEIAKQRKLLNTALGALYGSDA